MGDWSSLPSDLLVLVAEKLPFFPDLHRFAAVCVTWRAAASNTQRTIPCRTPLLLLECDDSSPNCNFLNLTDNRPYDMNIPELHRQWICGASHGWFIMLNDELALNLFNPFSKAQIELPRHPSIEGCLEFLTPESPLVWRWQYMNKVILSGSPTFGSDCFAVAIVSPWRKLAFCRVGDDRWITVETQINQYIDAICYGGRVYATRSFNLVVCTIGSNPEVTFIKYPKPNAPEGTFPQDTYIVESSGRILLVYRFRSVCEDGDIYFFKTRYFHVHQLDEVRGVWSRVESLGDHSLFLGNSRSFSCSVSGSFGYRPNCIYFVDDYLEGGEEVEGRVGFRMDFGLQLRGWLC